MDKLSSSGLYDAFIWLTYTFVGFLIPVLAGVVTRLASGGSLSLEWIAGSGQFAVSSAGLLMTTTYFVARPRSISRLPTTEWFVLLSVIGLVCGLFFFVLATLHLSGIAIISAYYQWPSIVLFAFALVIAFLAVRSDNMRDIDQANAVERSNQTQRDKLDAEFDSLLAE